MFEKEAEEYVMRVDVITENNRVPFDNGYGFQTISFEDEVKKGFQDGAEFGYNKANEWHYVKDEKPKDNEYVLIYTDLKNTYVARIPTEKDYFVTRRGGYVQMSAVIAWKEIVLPELKESE